MRRGCHGLGVVLLVTLASLFRVSSLGAGGPRQVEVRGTVGPSVIFEAAVVPLFPELPDTVVGGSLRVYLTERLSLEPEFIYYRDKRNIRERDNYDIIALNANVAYDLRGAMRRVKPYLLVGLGVVNFGARPSIGSFGLGVKIRLSKRWFVSPEIRGGPLFVQATGSVGYVLRDVRR